MAASVCIDVDLEQIPTPALIEELKARRKFDKDDVIYMDAWGIIEVLEEMGCPKHLLDQLKDWEAQPIADAKKLKVWKEACTTTNT